MFCFNSALVTLAAVLHGVAASRVETDLSETASSTRLGCEFACGARSVTKDGITFQIGTGSAKSFAPTENLCLKTCEVVKSNFLIFSKRCDAALPGSTKVSRSGARKLCCLTRVCPSETLPDRAGKASGTSSTSSIIASTSSTSTSSTSTSTSTIISIISSTTTSASISSTSTSTSSINGISSISSTGSIGSTHLGSHTPSSATTMKTANTMTTTSKAEEWTARRAVGPAGELYSAYLEAAGLANEFMKGRKIVQVMRGLGKLSREELEDALEEFGRDDGFIKLVRKKLKQKQRDDEQKINTRKQSVGASEDAKKVSRQRQIDEWAVNCSNGLKVKFAKTASLEDTFDELVNGFASHETMLAFDMDGTLNWMKEHNTQATIQTLREKAAAMQKVVITARRNDRVSNCNMVLATLTRAEGGSDIKDIFGLPNECTEENRLPSAQGRGPLAVPGLIMNEYAKAEGLVAYIKAGLSTAPEHVVFYDDYVLNPVNMAQHLCRREKWPELKQLTAVWYATPEAQLRDKTIEGRIKRGELDATLHTEGSYFAPGAEKDAMLAGQRALFGVQ